MTSPPVAQDGQWHRLHPLTPLIRSWQVVAVLLVIGGQNVGDSLLSADREAGLGRPGGLAVAIVVGIVIAVIAAGVGLAVLSWRFTRYRISQEAFELRSGVIWRQQRRARLDRLQAVDVVQPFVARLVGLARLRLEVAGGSDSGISLSYLTEAQAQSLRGHLLARAAGVGYATDEAPEAPEHRVVEVPPGRLVLSLLVSGVMVNAVLLVGAVLTASLVFSTAAALTTLVPGLLGVVGVLWSRFNGGFGFTAATSPDGLRLRHGLLEHRSQTVPPGRVQALVLEQSLLWRRPDWWRVQVTVAGYSGDSQSGIETDSVLLPVGSRAEALMLLRLVVPDHTVDDHALTGRGEHGGFLTSSPRAKRLDPWVWRRNGVRVESSALTIRSGLLRRRLAVVPHARTQSIAMAQGPLQRRLGLATVTLHTTPGPVDASIPHLAASEAAVFVQQQAERARHARSASGPERWMQPSHEPASHDPASREPASHEPAAPEPTPSPHQPGA